MLNLQTVEKKCNTNITILPGMYFSWYFKLSSQNLWCKLNKKVIMFLFLAS